MGRRWVTTTTIIERAMDNDGVLYLATLTRPDDLKPFLARYFRTYEEARDFVLKNLRKVNRGNVNPAGYIIMKFEIVSSA